jgi:hypothetical protein
MAFERPPGAIEVNFRIKMQYYSRDFTPVRTFRVRVEQSQIGDEVFPVVGGQHGLGGRGIGNIWIKRRHGRSRDVVDPPIIALAPWHIDDSRFRGSTSAFPPLGAVYQITRANR